MIIESAKLDAARRRECPACGAPGLIPGPKGGASQNFYCGACGQGWNLHGLAYGLLGLDPIGPVAPDLVELYRGKDST